MCQRRLMRELKELKKNPLTEPTIVAVPNDANILEWHYVIEGVQGSDFEGGFYHGKLVFPRDYPLKPPSVLMLTPSGRFQTNRRLCLSMSDFHPESWNPLWSVSTILTGLYSFMMDKSPTLGSIETTRAQKRKFAQESLAFNVRDKDFVRLFPEYVELHQKQMEKRQNGEESATVTDEAASVAGAGDGELHGILAGAAGVLAIVSIFFAMRFL